MANQEQQFKAITPDAKKKSVKGKEEQQKKLLSVSGEFIKDLGNEIEYLGVRVEKGNGGAMVPEAAAFADYAYTKEDYILMRDLATSFNLNHPLLVEGGTGIGKTSAVKRMASDLNMNYCLVSFSENTDLMDVIGHRDVVIEDGQEQFKWFDGKLTEAIRHGGVAFLDEYNFQGGKVGGRLNPIIDSILNGDKRVILPENNNEVVQVHPQFRLVAAQNPPGTEEGEEFTGRDVLSAEKFGRWTYHKLPLKMSQSMEEQRLLGMIGMGKKAELTSEDFRYAGEGIPLSELGDLPGMEHWVKKFVEIKQLVEKKVADRSMGMQSQKIYLNPRLGQKIIRYVANFYSGDINETWRNALEYYILKMFKVPEDQAKIREVIKQSEFVETKTSKRRPLESDDFSDLENKIGNEELKEILKMKGLIPDEQYREFLTSAAGGAESKKETSSPISEHIAEKYLASAVKRRKGYLPAGEDGYTINEATKEAGLNIERNLKYWQDFWQGYGVSFEAQGIADAGKAKESLAKGMDWFVGIPEISTEKLRDICKNEGIQVNEFGKDRLNLPARNREGLPTSNYLLASKMALNIANSEDSGDPDLSKKDMNFAQAEKELKDIDAHGLTYKEYLILNIISKKTTGKFLDINSWTWLPDQSVPVSGSSAYGNYDDDEVDLDDLVSSASSDIGGVRPSDILSLKLKT